MEIIIWLIVFLLAALSSVIYRFIIAIKKYENNKFVKVNDIIIYLFLVVAVIIAICFAIIEKTVICYLYLCAGVFVFIINILLSILIFYLNHKEI